MPLRKPFHMDLDVDLTTVEIAAKSKELAGLVARYDDEDAHRKDVARTLKTKLDTTGADLRKAARCVSTGKEQRPVECEESYNVALKTVEVIRVDTGEVVSSRAMAAGEVADARQRKLTLAGAGTMT